MSSLFENPIYRLTAKSGKKVTIDVTSSLSAGLPPNKVVADTLVDFFHSKHVETIVDFGAGALRHTFPLLEAGFEVCAVEFEEQLKKPAVAEAYAKAEHDFPNFCTLVWPKHFKKDKRHFDAALVCYVLQVMPIRKERDVVLQLLKKKLNAESYLLVMSRFGQSRGIPKEQVVKDGFYMYPERDAHSFYSELPTEQLRKQIERHGFHRIRPLSERGTDQILLYGKGSSTWI